MLHFSLLIVVFQSSLCLLCKENIAKLVLSRQFNFLLLSKWATVVLMGSKPAGVTTKVNGCPFYLDYR